jgi:adenosine deaminase
MFSLLNLIISVPKSYIDIYHLLQPFYKHLHNENIIYIEPSLILDSFSLHPSDLMKGFTLAKEEAESLYGIKTNAIYTISRCNSIEKSKQILQTAEPFKDLFVGLNAAGHEELLPASQIKELYSLARNLGFAKDGHATIHTGEETSPDFIISSLAYLGLTRIDHGVRAVEDPFLMKFLGDNHFSLAMCPVSNKKLKVCERFSDGKYVYHQFVEAGCRVSVNSDDPYMMDGFLNDVFKDLYQYYGEGLPGGLRCYVDFIRNGFLMSFNTENEKKRYVRMVDEEISKIFL